MVPRRTAPLTLLVLTLLGFLCPPALARRQANAEEINARISKEGNPVKKAKLIMQLGYLKLSESSDAYDKGNYEKGAKLLDEYTDCMQQAWTILDHANRDAVKHPAGFKELEINLREGRRLIQDLAAKVSYEVRDPVLKAGSEVADLSNKVILALFPGANPLGEDEKK